MESKARNLAKTSAEEMDEIRRQTIGMSFQGRSLVSVSMTSGRKRGLCLFENTPSWHRLHHRNHSSAQTAAGRARRLRILHGRRSSVAAMKKRAAVARALAMDPEILCVFRRAFGRTGSYLAAGIDELIMELKRAFHMDHHCGLPHELASAFLIADRACCWIDKGNIVALGTTEEMRSSTQPRVRQFLDRIAEPEVSGELDYLQMLTAVASQCA